MTIWEMLHDDNENIRAYGNACLKNAIEEQIKKNKGKTSEELEEEERLQDMLDDIKKELFGEKL